MTGNPLPEYAPGNFRYPQSSWDLFCLSLYKANFLVAQGSIFPEEVVILIIIFNYIIAY